MAGDSAMLTDVTVPILESGLTPFCSGDNVNQCLSYINQELVSLGITSLCDPLSETFDITRLVNAMYSLLQRLRQGVRTREDLEDSKHKALTDLEHHHKEKKRLKSLVEQLKRDLSQEHAKLCSLMKVNSLVGNKLKAEKEEVKRLTLLVQNRDIQYKHSVRKVEGEMVKLKDRLHSSYIEKTDRKTGIEMSDTLLRSDGRRAKWKTGCSNIEDLYQSEMKNCESKQKRLLLENHELRQGLKEIHKELSILLTCTTSEKESFSEEELAEADTTDNFVCDGSFEMPFELIGDAVVDKIRKQIGLIQAKMKNSGSRVPIDSKLKEDQCLEIEKLQRKVERYRSLVEHMQMLYKHNTSTERLLSTMSLVDIDFVEKPTHKKLQFEADGQYLCDSLGHFDKDDESLEETSYQLDGFLGNVDNQNLLLSKSVQLVKPRKTQET